MICIPENKMVLFWNNLAKLWRKPWEFPSALQPRNVENLLEN